MTGSAKPPIIPMLESDYADLQFDSMLLRALEQVGVDNWEGYSEALKLVESWVGDGDG